MRISSLARVTARLLTGYTYGTLGMDSFREPGGRVAAAGPTLDAVRSVAPFIPDDDELLVRANGLTQSVAGGLLALGVKPRLMALIITATLIPTTIAGHGFWKLDDPAARSGQRVQFRKNVAMVGGLLFCALDNPKKK